MINKEMINKLVILVLAPVATLVIDYSIGQLGNEIGFGIIIGTYGSLLIFYFLLVLLMFSVGKIDKTEKDNYIMDLEDKIDILLQSIRSNFEDSTYKIDLQQKKLSKTITDLESIIEQSKSNLLNNDQLAEYEEKIETDEIWVVEHDLALELNDPSYIRAIRVNLERDCVYRFFIPEIPMNVNFVHQLSQQINVKGNVYIYYLKNIYYILSPNTSYTIYNPNKKHTNEECFIGMTIGENGEAVNAKLSINETRDMIGNLRVKMEEVESKIL